MSMSLFLYAGAFSAFSMADSRMATSPSSFLIDGALEEYISRAEKRHNSDFQFGEAVFGNSAQLNKGGDMKKWSDDEFISYSVGIGNGGPSESVLENGHRIFETKEAVLDESTCNFLIEKARETIKSRHDMDGSPDDDVGVTNSDLGEARLSQLPSDALEELNILLQEQLYPMLTNRFGMYELTVYDGLILGNIAPSRSQPVHRDASMLTLNIALSSPDEFVQGGTYIEGLLDNDGLPLRIDRGKVLSHSSGIMHAGNAITEGERWVLVLFVIAKNEPQIARRTHAEGLDLIQSNLLPEAKSCFEAGLTAAPDDHLLHMGLGQIASMRGEERESFRRLSKASKLYPSSHKAAMAAGKILEGKRRSRAALRRFEEVLADVNDKDMIDGAWMPLKALAWDARICAGRCALLCAEIEAQKIDRSYRERTWTKNHLPKAIERLHIGLIPDPGDQYINSMLQRAEELLEDANSYPGSSE